MCAEKNNDPSSFLAPLWSRAASVGLAAAITLTGGAANAQGQEHAMGGGSDGDTSAPVAETTICRDPGMEMPRSDRLRAARRCADALMIGTVSTTVITDTKRPLGRVLSMVARDYDALTGTKAHLRIRSRKPTNQFTGLLNVLAGADGCVKIDDKIAATQFAEHDSRYNPDGLTIFATDRPACFSTGQTHVASGVANNYGGLDVYEVGERDKYGYQYSARGIADVALHELGHNLGMGHMGNIMPPDALDAKIIPDRFISAEGILDLPQYVEASTHKVYDDTCVYAMGGYCAGNSDLVIPQIQKNLRDWYKPLLSGKPLPGFVRMVDGTGAISIRNRSKDVLYVPLATEIFSKPSVGQVGSSFQFGWDALALESDRKGYVSAYLVSEANKDIALLGDIDMRNRPDGITFLMYNSQSVTLTPQPGGWVHASVRPANPNENEGQMK